MYQSIDDDIAPEDMSETPPSRTWIWPVGILAGGATLAILWFAISSMNAPTGQVDSIQPEPVARKDYLRALAEPIPALRRARLTDFLNQYSENPRISAVRAQLAILDGAADRDWQATLTTAYDPRLDIELRLSAVSAYQEKWGRYLGARDTEIKALIEDIQTTPLGEDVPDRTLPRNEDAYRGIPNDRLAGDRFGRQPSVIFRTSRENRNETPPGSASGSVIGPTVIREITPRYPRRAQRRGVEGSVVLSLTIDEQGRVSLVELITVNAPRYADDFVKEAERAALRTRFDPRTVDGTPVVTQGIQKRYRFELE